MAETPERELDPILWRSVHQYDRCRPDRRYGSTILIDGEEVAQLLCCVHCRAHFLNVRIPGKERGWCMNCNGPVCPNKKCDTCFPFEKWLESVERGLRPDQMPVKAAVSHDPPKLVPDVVPSLVEEAS